MQSGKLILRKIIETVATRCHISILAGASSQTPLGKLTALPNPLAELKGPTSKGMDGRKDGREEQRRGESRGEGRGKRTSEQFPFQTGHYTTGVDSSFIIIIV